eukprot:4666452-Pyramimonas_sp.AAC.1
MWPADLNQHWQLPGCQPQVGIENGSSKRANIVQRLARTTVLDTSRLLRNGNSKEVRRGGVGVEEYFSGSLFSSLPDQAQVYQFGIDSAPTGIELRPQWLRIVALNMR